MSTKIQRAALKILQCLESPLITSPFESSNAEVQALGERRRISARAALEIELVRLDAALESSAIIDLDFDADAVLASLAILSTTTEIPVLCIRAGGYTDLLRDLLLLELPLLELPLLELPLQSNVLTTLAILEESSYRFLEASNNDSKFLSTLFHQCVVEKHVNSARLIFACGPHVMHETYLRAIYDNSVELVELMQRRKDIRQLRSPVYDHKTGFEHACGHGFTEIVSLMIPLVTKEQLLQGLWTTLRKGHVDTVRLLLPQCPMVVDDVRGEICAQMCQELCKMDNRVDILQVLVEENPQFNPSMSDNLILAYAQSHGASMEFLEMLFEDPRVKRKEKRIKKRKTKDAKITAV